MLPSRRGPRRDSPFEFPLQAIRTAGKESGLPSDTQEDIYEILSQQKILQSIKNNMSKKQTREKYFIFNIQNKIGGIL